MRKLLFFVFNIIIFFLLVSDSTSDKIICMYDGSSSYSIFQLNVADIPDRCQIIQPSLYVMGADENEKDINEIKELVEANKTVYIRLTSPSNVDWSTIFKDTDKLEKLLSYIQNNNIKGILLNDLKIYHNKKTYLAKQILEFVKNIKTRISSLKVGMIINGQECDHFSEFDYEVVNGVIDVYVIDSTNAGFACNADSEKNGRFPKTTENEGIASLSDIIESVKKSKMVSDKVFIGLAIGVDYIENKIGRSIQKSYVKYCTEYSANSPSLWCADSTKILYDNAVHVRGKFAGLALMYLNRDDFNGQCECGKKFPVANTYLDGWTDEPMKTCDKISGPKS